MCDVAMTIEALKNFFKHYASKNWKSNHGVTIEEYDHVTYENQI